MPAYAFDPKRAKLGGPDFFKRFGKVGAGSAIGATHFDPDLDLIIVERGGERVSFLVKDLARPHGVQGALNRQPYVVSF